jgi:hypothetical protein
MLINKTRLANQAIGNYSKNMLDLNFLVLIEQTECSYGKEIAPFVVASELK